MKSQETIIRMKPEVKARFAPLKTRKKSNTLSDSLKNERALSGTSIRSGATLFSLRYLKALRSMASL